MSYLPSSCQAFDRMDISLQRAESRKENVPPRTCPIRSDDSNTLPANSSLITKPIPLTDVRQPGLSRDRRQLDVNPLDTPTYLKSSIDILVESVESPANHVSIFDLLDAYHAFTTRIRSQSHIITLSNQVPPAFALLKSQSAKVLQALSRDIRWALFDPLNTATLSAEVPASTVARYEVKGETLKHAKHLVSLCHHALRVVSYILKFRALRMAFKPTQLEILLDGLLELALVTTLPTPNAGKTSAYVILILQSQRLPISILGQRKTQIASALHIAVRGGTGQLEKPNGLLAGLKAIQHLLKEHGFHFFLPLSDVLPSVLPYLASSSVKIRLQVIRTLNAFASIKRNSSQALVVQNILPISRHVRSFIDMQPSRRTLSSENQLEATIRDALCLESVDHPGQGPLWALNLLACLIVLSDYLLFSHPRSLKLILPLLAQASVHRRSVVRSAYPQTWKCLIWAFSRLRLARDMDQPAGALEDRAFLLVKQQLDGGIGTALVISLLETRDTAPAVSRAVGIINEMIHSSNVPTYREGRCLLNRLVSVAGSPRPKIDGESQPGHKTLVAAALFNGTLLNPDWRHVSAALAACQPNISGLACLTPTDLIRHWDSLATIWTRCVQQSLQEVDFQSSDLLHLWHSLLLVRASSSQQLGHTTPDMVFLHQMASIVESILVETSANSTLRIERLLRRMVLARRLWITTKNLFSVSLLSSPAQTILDYLREHPAASDEKSQLTWSNLCWELIAVHDEALLSLICGHREGLTEKEISRKNWFILATTWSSSEACQLWQNAASLLIIPIRHWSMADYEDKLWNLLLLEAYMRAGSALIEHLLLQLGEEYIVEFPESALAIISTTISSEDTPTHMFQSIDTILVRIYPPPSELKPACIRFLRHLKNIMGSSPESHVVPMLVTLTSLCRWIEDDARVFSDVEYNDVVVPLYTCSLSMLRLQTPSLDILHSLAPLLTSIFVRVPPPASGPLEFASFWEMTYHGLSLSEKCYPQNIQSCLKALDAAFNRDFSADFSSETMSQSED